MVDDICILRRAGSDDRYNPSISPSLRAGVIFQRPTSDAKSSIVHVTCRHNRSLLRIADYLDNGSAIVIAREDPRGKTRNAREPSDAAM